MLTGELVKASITNLDTEDSVEVMFNPTDYTFSKANNWQPSKKKGANEPPQVEFRWGTMWSFKAVIANITQKFTLFLADGTPVRASVDVVFRQVEDEGLYPRQNPTSGGVAGHRTHTMKEGETLDWLAAKEYGSAAQWRFIAEVNKIDDPFQLKPGTVISLPPLP